MAGEWTQTTLGSIACTKGYGLVDGPFGSNLPASCYTDEGIPVIRPRFESHSRHKSLSCARVCICVA